MKTEIVIINRTPVWVSFDYLTVKNTLNGKLQNYIVCYYTLTEPADNDSGELLTNNQNETLYYPDIDNARNGAIHVLKSRIYPPKFLHPLEYTIDNIEEIMSKPIFIETGEVDSDRSEYSFKGIITQCSFAGNPPYLPVAAKIVLENGNEIICNFFELKKIRNP